MEVWDLLLTFAKVGRPPQLDGDSMTSFSASSFFLVDELAPAPPPLLLLSPVPFFFFGLSDLSPPSFFPSFFFSSEDGRPGEVGALPAVFFGAILTTVLGSGIGPLDTIPAQEPGTGGFDGAALPSDAAADGDTDDAAEPGLAAGAGGEAAGEGAVFAPADGVSISLVTTFVGFTA